MTLLVDGSTLAVLSCLIRPPSESNPISDVTLKLIFATRPKYNTSGQGGSHALGTGSIVGIAVSLGFEVSRRSECK
jgi:hypothetical protein